MADFEIIFTTRIGILKHLTGMHYLEIPENVIAELGGFNNRLICTVNNQLKFQGGTMALGEGRGYVTISTAKMKQLNLELGSTVSVKIEPDHSEFGTEVPEELEVVFASDKEGFERFMLLTKAMQRYIINYVKTVKSSDKRIERSLLLIGNLKTLEKGKETFREMLGKPPRE